MWCSVLAVSTLKLVPFRSAFMVVAAWLSRCYRTPIVMIPLPKKIASYDVLIIVLWNRWYCFQSIVSWSPAILLSTFRDFLLQFLYLSTSDFPGYLESLPSTVVEWKQKPLKLIHKCNDFSTSVFPGYHLFEMLIQSIMHGTCLLAAKRCHIFCREHLGHENHRYTEWKHGVVSRCPM